MKTVKYHDRLNKGMCPDCNTVLVRANGCVQCLNPICGFGLCDG